jgi:hypothetical protein
MTFTLPFEGFVHAPDEFILKGTNIQTFAHFFYKKLISVALLMFCRCFFILPSSPPGKNETTHGQENQWQEKI